MSFFDELKRRNVFRVGIAYLVVAWLVLQVADVVINNVGAPGWVFQIIMMVLGIGFPIVLIFAWAFEMTPEGIKKEKDVDRTQSITSKTGRKLDFTIIGVLALVAVYFVWESRFQAEPNVIPAKAGTAQFSNAANQVPASAGMTGKGKDKSIAVLPFANRSNVEDDLFFTDGIHDDLLTQLAKISGLKVTSRTSVMEYRDTTKKIPEIAAELGVATILEGGIQRAGNRIRINAQLIDVNTDEHLWAETFDREMTVENIFDIQSEITRHIVSAVRGELTSEEADVLAQIPTKNLRAYEAYLQAKNIFLQADYTQQKYEAAELWLKMAVELDPEFALAWAMLVSAHAQAIWIAYDDSPGRLQQVREALKKATEFGPFLPETLAARAEYMYRIENNYQEAEVAFRAASQAKPGDAELVSRLGITQRRTGKWQQAISNFKLAFELDPEDVDTRTTLIETLLLMREYDQAAPLFDSWIEKYPQAMDIKSYKLFMILERDGDLISARNLFDQIDPNSGNPYFYAATFLPILERDYQVALDIYNAPGFVAYIEERDANVFALQNKSALFAFMGNTNRAQEFAQQAIEAYKQKQSSSSGTDLNNAFMLSGLAQVYAQSGDFEKALDSANQACELMPESRDSYFGASFSNARAWVLAMSGHRDEALSEIERLLSIPAGLNRWLLYRDPNWDFFRDDERFNDLIRPLKLKGDEA